MWQSTEESWALDWRGRAGAANAAAAADSSISVGMNERITAARRRMRHGTLFFIVFE